MNASIEGGVDRWQSQIEKTDFLKGVQENLAQVERDLGLPEWVHNHKGRISLSYQFLFTVN